MKKKIYILTSSFTFKANEIQKLFPSRKFQIFHCCKGKKYSESEIINYFSDAYGIIAGTEKYSSKVLNKLKNLKYISRCGVGIDNIDLIKIKEQKIKLMTTKNSHIKVVAEHAIAGLFVILKKIIHFNNEVKSDVWKKSYVDTIYNKKIGFYGYGKIAKQIKKNLNGFNSKFFYCDNNVNKTSSNIQKINTIKSLFGSSDIIFICSSLTDNKHVINKNVLSNHIKKKIIINTSRGELLHEKDMIDYLKMNNKSYYFSDVFEKEPYRGAMKRLKNTIFTPHVSTYEPHFRSKMEMESLLNLKKVIK